MKHSAQRRRGWKSEAEIHQTGTPEPHRDKKCQLYFQQSDNCGAIWSARVEEKDPFFQETGHPAARCRDFSHSSDSKGLWELAEGKDPRKKVSADRAHSMYGKQFNIFFMELSHRSWASLKGGWCTGTTQRDGMGREEGGGFRMGNTCIPVADSFWYLANLIQLC